MCHQGLVILVIMTVAQTVFFCSDVERGVRVTDPCWPSFQPREQKSLIPRPFLPTQGAEKLHPYALCSNPESRKVTPLGPFF